MNFWLILTAVFAAMLVAFASSATARDILSLPVAWLIELLSNFVEEVSTAITSILLLGLIALCFWLSLRPQPEDWHLLTGRAVSEERVDSKITPLVGASVRLGQYETRTGDDGVFELRFAQKPSDNTFLTITHPGYVTYFLRHDDPLFSGGSVADIQMSPKMRIIVAEFDGGGDAEFEAYRRNIENRLTLRDQIELLAEREKEALFTELRITQQQRGIYDEATLVKIGSFHGATHGVLGSIKRQKDGVLIECRLISFRTREIRATAEVLIPTSEAVDLASAYVADRLLAQLTRIKILSPRSPAASGETLSLHGYATFRPKSWQVWISVLPVGNPKHFPQERVTPQEDGTWNASSVHLGEARQSSQPLEFDVYALITDPEKTREIETYLKTGKSTGLDVADWMREQQCQILHSIRVARVE